MKQSRYIESVLKNVSKDLETVHLRDLVSVGAYSMSLRVLMIAQLGLFLSNKPCHMI